MAEGSAQAQEHHDHGHGAVLDNRHLIVREDILAKAKELAHLISTTEEVSLFQRAEKLVQRNEKVQNLIAQMKKKQKEIVAFETTFKNQP